MFRLEFIPPDFQAEEHFLSQYGKIGHIKNCSNCWSRYVIYNGEHSVPRTLPHITIQMFAADRICGPPCLQLDPKTEHIFKKLNATCMYELLKYLNIIDICHLKKAINYCTEIFDDVLQNSVRTKLFNLQREIEDHSGCSILTILENAGKFIQFARINVRTLTNSFLKQILSKCPNLKYLTLQCIDISNHSLNEPPMLMFLNLLILCLMDVRGSENDFTNLISTLNGGIKRILARDCSGLCGHHFKKFKVLENFNIGCNNNVTIADIEMCLRVNSRTIKGFAYKEPTLVKYNKSIDSSFFNLLANLTSCHLELIGKDLIVELKYFENLNVLKLNCIKLQFSNNVEVCKIFDTLKVLHLSFLNSDDSFNIIQKFHNLKELTIKYFYYPEDFVTNLIGKFRNVESFHIGVDHRINRNDLMELIKSMVNLKVLHFQIYTRQILNSNFINEYKQWRDQYKPDMKLVCNDQDIFSN